MPMTRIPDPDENRETRWPESDAGPPDFDSDEWHEDEFGSSKRPYDTRPAEDRRVMYIVICPVDDRESYTDPEAFGPFETENECYSFAATISQEPNDWLPLKVQTPR